VTVEIILSTVAGDGGDGGSDRKGHDRMRVATFPGLLQTNKTSVSSANASTSRVNLIGGEVKFFRIWAMSCLSTIDDQHIC
jgi:hypothetical protein